MDIGTVVSWLQISFWLWAGFSWLKKMAHDKALELPTTPRSTWVLGTAVIVGLLISGVSLYFNYRARTIVKTVVQTVTETKFLPPVLTGWGDASGRSCAVVINGDALLELRDKYEVGAVLRNH